MIKKILAWILPEVVFSILRQRKQQFEIRKQLKKAYQYDMDRYLRFSDSFGSDSSQKLIGSIIRDYHVVEKGLTMPDTRFGFGKELIIRLVKDCIKYIKRYGETDEQLNHAISVILEYEQFHQNQNFQLEHDVLRCISDLNCLVSESTTCSQRNETVNSYFMHKESPFPQFAASRSSVRNYTTEDIDIDRIIMSLELARNTPSACNRQCWRTYVYEDNDKINSILLTQGGNRGFGHLTNKLIVLTAEVGVFSSIGERNECYIDGGIYAMNLLYGLHYQNIGACILNCSNTIEKDVKLRELCQIKDSEVFIAMVACGIPPDNFKIASSPRYKLATTNKIVFKC